MAARVCQSVIQSVAVFGTKSSFNGWVVETKGREAAWDKSIGVVTQLYAANEPTSPTALIGGEGDESERKGQQPPQTSACFGADIQNNSR